jgi:hypothetical protein
LHRGKGFKVHNEVDYFMKFELELELEPIQTQMAQKRRLFGATFLKARSGGIIIL